LSKSTLISLKKSGKKFIFFDNYVIEIKPFYMNIQTDYKGTKVTLGKDVLFTSSKDDDKKQVGPFLPGSYKINGELKTDLSDIKNDFDVDVFNSGTEDINIDLSVQFLSISCSTKDAKVFVNGIDSGKTVKDFNNYGPFAKDQAIKISVQKDYPWGTAKSAEVNLSNGYANITLNPLNDALKDTLMKTINDYAISRAAAWVALDPSKLINLTPDKKADFTTSINNMKANKETYTGTITKSTFDLDSIKVYLSNSKYYADITDDEIRNELYLTMFSTNKTTLEDKEYKSQYTLAYDEESKTWSVDSASTAYSFSNNNVKSFDLK